MTLSLEAKSKLLRKVSLFGSLGGMELSKVAELVEEQRFFKNSGLIKEGENGDCLFVIVQGRVKVSKLQEGNDNLVAVLHEGDTVGELALFDFGPRSATVTALDEVLVLTLNRDKILQLIRRVPEVAVSILDAMAKKVRTATDAFTLCQR